MMAFIDEIKYLNRFRINATYTLISIFKERISFHFNVFYSNQRITNYKGTVSRKRVVFSNRITKVSTNQIARRAFWEQSVFPTLTSVAIPVQFRSNFPLPPRAIFLSHLYDARAYNATSTCLAKSICPKELINNKYSRNYIQFFVSVDERDLLGS